MCALKPVCARYKLTLCPISTTTHSACESAPCPCQWPAPLYLCPDVCLCPALRHAPRYYPSEVMALHMTTCNDFHMVSCKGCHQKGELCTVTQIPLHVAKTGWDDFVLHCNHQLRGLCMPCNNVKYNVAFGISFWAD